ncbi:hypothetical protein E2P81_ATG10940 [Venturia nashicola]|nr:hypothetical protein E2P81_ATG10940 [Venturia nashicola]
MVAIWLPFRGQDVRQSPGYNAYFPNDQVQQQSQSQKSYANPWVEVLEDGDIVVTCCQDGSPYHKLVCGHLIFTLSQGCGRTCRVAVNSTEKLRTEFNCDRCTDEETFADTMKQIREFCSAAILANRIVLLEHLQPYIDAFTRRLSVGRRVRLGRRGRKAFAKTNEELVEHFQVQIERLVERSCRYFLDLLMKKRGSEMYDEPDEDDEGEELGGQLLDDTEEGEIVEDDADEDIGESGEDETFSELTATISLRRRPNADNIVEHKLSVVDSLISSVDFGDSFGSVEELMEAEEDWMEAEEDWMEEEEDEQEDEQKDAQDESPLKRGRGDGLEFDDEQDDTELDSPSKKARL